MSGDRDWKAAYLEQLDQQRSLEQTWAEERDTLRQTIVTLAGAAWGRSAELDAMLKNLRDAARGEDEAASLLCVSRAARDFVLQHSSAREQPDPGPDRNPATLRVSASLLSLLDSFDLPALARSRLGTLRVMLDQPNANHSPAELVSELAALLSALRAGVLTEKKEFQAFLQAVTSRMEKLQASLVSMLGQHGEADLDGNTLQSGFNDHLAVMRDSVAAADDLSSLKHTIRSSIDHVEGMMTSFLRADAERRQQLQAALQGMDSELTEVQQESRSLREQLEATRKRAMTDGLTGLYNRMALDARLQQEVSRWQRHGHPLSLVIVDVDHFKRINDNYGHQTGDRVLQGLAKRLRRIARESDTVGRYGGEEFVMVLPDTSIEQAANVAEKVRAMLERLKFMYEGAAIPMTLSAGVAQAQQGETGEQIVERADQALYRAKTSGRNRVERAH